MARKKVKVAYITNNSARKATFKKRKRGMMKKMDELSTLCGIDACAIVYNPFDSRPEVWPSKSGVEKVLNKFKNMSVIEKNRKMLSQETYLRGMISKASEQLNKVRMQNREKELKVAMYQSLTTGTPQFQNLDPTDIDVLGRLINQKLNEIDKKGKSLTGEEMIKNQKKDVQASYTKNASNSTTNNQMIVAKSS
ncbi:agamous-like MADS-box protein AGL80 [Argentina anserina]|uniref:agamous-like MADS-box protein AGL80 n=1 Tax=Argentina anserina TaxID=57926 RepID=UPI002176652C|nr:agamous-like MADS-box protein AGL80 [Potentilla anserina]